MLRTQVRQGQSIEAGGLARKRVLLFYATAYLLFGAAGLRMAADYWETPFRLYIFGLLAVYLLLLSTERFLSNRWPAYHFVYYPLQVLVVLALSRAEPSYDYYGNLFLGLFLQTIWFAPKKWAPVWIGLFTVCIIGSEIVLFGLADGLPYVLTYVGGGFFISILAVSVDRAEQARAESQALLAELQVANRMLKEYADQVEELATVQERNRLARELHDSVTQTIFSMTLTAQSALILIDRDPGRVKEQLGHLKELSKSALAEMRGLIQQLHPRTVAEKGLAAALQELAAEKKEKDGLAVEVQVWCTEGAPPRLPAESEESLFRVIQEALNNVVKHAQTDSATVTLDLRASPASLTIEDRGTGFDPGRLGSAPGHLGLTSMEERVRALGGRLRIESRPGAGTRIRIEGLRLEEWEHA
jgi:signal transduction histidine kinase